MFTPKYSLILEPENLTKFLFHYLFQQALPVAFAGKGGHQKEVEKAVHRPLRCVICIGQWAVTAYRVMQPCRRLKRHICRQTAPDKPNYRLCSRKGLRHNTAGAYFGPCPAQGELTNKVGEIIAEPDLKICRDAFGQSVHRVVDLGCGVGPDLDRVDDNAWTVDRIKIADAPQRIDYVLAGYDAQPPRIIPVARDELARFLDEIVEMGNREDEPPEHPSVIAVAVSCVIDDRLGHRKSGGRKQASVIDGSGKKAEHRFHRL